MTFRIVTTVWGDPVPLDRERAKILREKAEARFSETRKKGSKLSSPGMEMLNHFAHDYDGELIGARDLTHDYLAEQTIMSVSSVQRCLKDLEDAGLVKVIHSKG